VADLANTGSRNFTIKTHALGLFMTFTRADIIGFAKLLGISENLPPKTICTRIARVMFSSNQGQSQLELLFSKLGPIEQAYVSEVLYQRPAADLVLFALKYSAQPTFSIPTESDSHLRQLTLINLFVFINQLPATAVKFMTQELADNLISFVPPPPADELRALAEPVKIKPEAPFVIHASEFIAPDELSSILAQLASAPANTNAGGAGSAQKSIEDIDAALIGGDFFDSWRAKMKKTGVRGHKSIRGHAWGSLLCVAKLAKIRDNKYQLMNAGHQATQAAPAVTLKQIWNSWLKTNVYDEAQRISSLSGYIKTNKLNKPSARRRIIVSALQTCPVNQWIKFDDFFWMLFIRSTGFTLSSSFASFEYEGRMINEVCSPFMLHKVLERSYLLAFLFEYAATLGIIDIAFHPPGDMRNTLNSTGEKVAPVCVSVYDGLSCFRINPLGAYILGLTATYEICVPAIAKKIHLGPGLKIKLAPDPANKPVAALLKRFATTTAPDHFTLSMDKALETVASGSSVSVIALLLEQSGEPVPPEMQAWIAELDRRTGMLTITGETRLIECATEDLALDVAYEWKTKYLCKIAGPTTVAVPARSEQSFRDVLMDLGYPIVQGAPQPLPDDTPTP